MPGTSGFSAVNKKICYLTQVTERRFERGGRLSRTRQLALACKRTQSGKGGGWARLIGPVTACFMGRMFEAKDMLKFGTQGKSNTFFFVHHGVKSESVPEPERAGAPWLNESPA